MLLSLPRPTRLLLPFKLTLPCLVPLPLLKLLCPSLVPLPLLQLPCPLLLLPRPGPRSLPLLQLPRPGLRSLPLLQLPCPRAEAPPAKVPRVNLVLPEQPAQREEEPDKGMPMDVDEVPQVSFCACFISGRILTFKRSLSAAGGQRVPRMLLLKGSRRTRLQQ